MSWRANSKTRSTYYTPEKVEHARANIKKYDWAKKIRDNAVNEAECYVSLGYEFLWKLVPPQTLPRSYGVNQRLGSPVTGREIDKYGNYPYRADSVNDPWKIVDPSCGLKYPTNDFGAFYQSGLDLHGVFRPELADRSLLINKLYPEKGPAWCVDDGYGWVDEDGNRFTFIAYYVHWHLWYGRNSGMIQSAIRALCDAYIYTGDLRYARAGIVLLDRIADVYPSLNAFEYDPSIFLQSSQGTGGGKAVGSIWETGLVADFISAYDAFYPIMDDREAIGFLSGKANDFKLAFKGSGAALRRNAENGILRQVYPGVKEATIRGNVGMHQSALALAAVVLDTLPETKEWLDFINQAGGLERNPWRVTGGNMLASLVNDVDRDGYGNEGAPLYNRLWLSNFLRVANILYGYDKYPQADLYQNSKFRKMFSATFPLILSEAYMPTIGDTDATGNPGLSIDQSQMIRAFEVFRDPRFAQLAYFLNHNRAVGIYNDLFAEHSESISLEIEEVVRREGRLELPSMNLSGFGFTALRDGKRELDGQRHTLRDVWLYYGRNYGHGHRDTLNLGLHAFGLDLAPDLGYPEFADSLDRHRAQWVNHTVSHNTVVVDHSKQSPQWVGIPHHYDDTNEVKLIDVEAPDVYSATEIYRRLTAMIRVDAESSYTVDFFRVKGGSDHVFSFHSAEGTVSNEGLSLVAQPYGTYAGLHLPFGQRGDSVDGENYMGSGFHWLKEVERDEKPSAPFSVDWQVKDTWNVYGKGSHADTDVHLRLTMLGPVGDVALATGLPPRNKPGNPSELRYLLAHRKGSNLDSLFTSVIEPYRAEPFIRSITLAEVRREGRIVNINNDAAIRAIKVRLANGKTDTIIYSSDPTSTYTIEGDIIFQGYFGIYSEIEKNPVFLYIQDGTVIGKLGGIHLRSPGAVEGNIIGFTKELSVENRIEIKANLKGMDPLQLIGNWIYVQNDRVRNASYPIRGVTPLGDGRYRLDIGDLTIIRCYRDSNNPDKGYIYDIAEGAACRIPLSSIMDCKEQVRAHIN